MKRIPTFEEFRKDPEYWKKEALKPDPKGTEIFLCIGFIIASPFFFFMAPYIMPEYKTFFKISSAGFLLFALYILYQILFEKQIKIRQLKKEFGGKNIQLTKDEVTGETIVVVEE